MKRWAVSLSIRLGLASAILATCIGCGPPVSPTTPGGFTPPADNPAPAPQAVETVPAATNGVDGVYRLDVRMARSGTAAVALSSPNADISLKLYLTSGGCANATDLVAGACTILGAARPGESPCDGLRAGHERRLEYRVGAQSRPFLATGHDHHRHRVGRSSVSGHRPSGSSRGPAAGCIPAGAVVAVDPPGVCTFGQIGSRSFTQTKLGGFSTERPMEIRERRPSAAGVRRRRFLLVAAACLLLPPMAAAQGLTGALIGTVKDAQGGVLSGAVVRMSSPALIGGPQTLTTDAKGELRFPALSPGLYVLDIEMPGFDLARPGHPHRGRRHYRANGCPECGRGGGINRGGRSGLAHRRAGPRIRDSFRRRATSTRSRRDGSARYDRVKTAPGIPPTSPAGGNVLVSAAVRRGPEPVSARRHEHHGDEQRRRARRPRHRLHPGTPDPVGRRVRGVRQRPRRGGQRHHPVWKRPFRSDTSYDAQTAALTSQPVRRPLQGPGDRLRAREVPRRSRHAWRPRARDRLWFFAGYQHLRDYDSQPGTDPMPAEKIPTGQGLREADLEDG